MNKLPDLEAWAIFAAVAEQRSFSGAAATLGLSKATVSKAVARLEARLGQSLFHRTSRRLSVTEAALPLAERARAMLAEAEGAEEAARDGAASPAGRIRVAAPMSFGLAAVAPVLAGFLDEYRQVEIDLNLSDSRTDIIAGGFDLALRIGEPPDSSLRIRRLCAVPFHIVASPLYLARHGRPVHAAELARHRLLGYSNAPGPWRLYGPDDEAVMVRPVGPLLANSGDALVPALMAGLGIARLPNFIVGLHLESKALEAILPDWTPPPASLHLLTPPGTLRPARVEALIAWLARHLRD
ncbi:LysR substrate-binding domain-containing protein [uncultured Sphingomonas sp.]|uniref:LysR family transcriptional regulator n=1 Tax=uncultured Sphingomonas sp. TaxID=158754 RepID=UPI0035C9A4FE